MESLIPSMRVMFRHIDLSYQSEEWAVSVLSEFRGTPEEFSFLQQHICPSFYQLSKQIRLRVALGITSGSPVLWAFRERIPEVVRTVLKMDILEPDDIKFSQEMDSTLIHSVAEKIGTCQGIFQSLGSAHGYQSMIDAWIGLCHDFLSVGIDIHYIVNGRTPLLSYIEGWLSERSSLAANGFVVQLWLEQLEAVGVDLSEYGKAEEFVWKNQTIRRELETWRGISITLRVIGFTYGPTPKDWHLWISDPTDSYVGEFWNMIERPVEVMPGSWPQE